MANQEKTAGCEPAASEAQQSKNNVPSLVAAVYPDAIVKAAERLSGIPRTEYASCRIAEAGALGIKVNVLDMAVVERHKARTGAKAVEFSDESQSAWLQPVELADILEEIALFLQRHTVLAKGAATAIALWVVHTHVYDVFDTSPRLLLSSPEKRCGKTTVMSIIGQLVHKPVVASNITPSAVFRLIEKAQPTLLIDEADTFLDKSDDMRGIINSGHGKATAYVVRNVGENHIPTPFSTWAPLLIALIGLPAETIQDRSITIPMRRKKPTETVERLSLRSEELARIKAKIIRWVDDYKDSVEWIDPAIPPYLMDRAADNWRPLLALAEMASPFWIDCAHKAARLLSQEDASQDQSFGVMLLSDLRDMFAQPAVLKLATAEICTKLAQLYHRPWPEWKNGKVITDRQLAILLQPFGIRPKNIRVGNVQCKGYEVSDLYDAFERYLP